MTNAEIAEPVLRELLETIYRCISDQPPSIEMVLGTAFIDINVIPAEGTVGQLLGKKGAHAAAVRTLLHATAGKYHVRLEFSIQG